MADDREPPPLFDSVSLDKKNEDTDDLFASALEVIIKIIISALHTHIFNVFTLTKDKIM